MPRSACSTQIRQTTHKAHTEDRKKGSYAVELPVAALAAVCAAQRRFEHPAVVPTSQHENLQPLIEGPAIPSLRISVLLRALTRPALRDSYGDDDFSSGVTLFQVADGLRRFAQRIRPVDHRRDLACLDELLQDLQVLPASFRFERDKPLAHER